MKTRTEVQSDPLLLEKASRIRLLVLDVDGVLTDGKLIFDQSGNESKSFSTRDGFGIKALQKFGIQVAIITGRTSDIVSRRAKELGIKYVYQGSDDKLSAFKEILNHLSLQAQQSCFAGDDWIDLAVLERVGLSVSVADADPVVRSRVHWVTQNGGGNGAVREICDLILQSQGLDKQLLNEMLSS